MVFNQGLTVLVLTHYLLMKDQMQQLSVQNINQIAHRCSSVGPNYEMISVIIYELGAIELQRTLVKSKSRCHSRPPFGMTTPQDIRDLFA